MASFVENVTDFQLANQAMDPEQLVGFDPRSGVQWYYAFPDSFDNDPSFETVENNPQLVRMLTDIHKKKIEQQNHREENTDTSGVMDDGKKTDVHVAKPNPPGLQREAPEVM